MSAGRPSLGSFLHAYTCAAPASESFEFPPPARPRLQRSARRCNQDNGIYITYRLMQTTYRFNYDNRCETTRMPIDRRRVSPDRRLMSNNRKISRYTCPRRPLRNNIFSDMNKHDIVKLVSRQLSLKFRTRVDLAISQ